ncbi:MAG: hypothetical protein FWG33_02255 [Oscillospiraceae bacterium]|nr:hypothetical protein [Oscillospiraceae bacterium]
MQQVSIEEVLGEFRKKYGDDSDNKATDTVRKEEDITAIDDVRAAKDGRPYTGVHEIKHRKGISFWRIVVIQSVISALILVFVVVCKFFNAEIYEYISDILGARL